MNHNIKTLAQLKEAKRQLRIQKQATKQLFFDSLSETRKSTTHFVTNKVLIPAGITGLTAWGASKLISNNNENGHSQTNKNVVSIANQFSDPNSPAFKLIQQLLPLGTKLLMAYLGKKTVEEVTE